VVANATVTATDLSTQTNHVTKTDKAGAYLFPGLPIGTYNLGVAADGFETYVQTGIVLEVGSSIAINAALAVGKADVKVEVHAEGLALQTEDVSFKQTIDENAVTEMPLNGRHMTDLITLSGGSSPAPAGDFTGSKFSYAAISVSVAGGGGNTTDWRLDGGTNNDFMANANLPFPFPDAVSQFSVESTALGAQSGMHSGGLVNVVTRSGTNTYHGSAFEFIRNNFIDATNFFATSKDQLHQNEYGGTFGGKILRDKLFAFAGYQFHEAKQISSTTTAYVPTAANLAGDWSNTDPAPGSPNNNCGNAAQLFDPVTGAALPGNKYAGTPPYNAAAKALLPYLPVINPAIDVYGCGKVSYAIPSIVYDKQFITRVDYTINSQNNLYGRYLLDGYQSPAQFSPTNILLTTANGNIERVQSLTIGENYTINSRTVNAAHLTGLRRVNNRGYSPSDINLTTLGVNVYQGEPNGLQLTVATSGKNHGFTLGGGTNSVAHFNDNTIAVSDDLTMMHGGHEIVLGGEFIRNQLNIGNAYEVNGTPTFNGVYSSNGPTGTGACTSAGKQVACPAGDANLDFLLGSMNSFQQSKQQQNALRAPLPSLYIQDTYHLSKRLTIVGGVRWSPEFFPVDYFGRGAVFNMNQFVANQFSSVYPSAPAGAFFYGDPGVPKAFTQSSPWQFEPNIGASYDPFGDGKTVIRGGVEVVYDAPNFFTGQRTQQNPPFATASNPNTASQLCFSEPWLVGGTGAGCAQVGGTNTEPYPQPQLPNAAQAVFPAQGQFIILPTQFHPSDTLQWTLSIQRQFGHGWQLQVDYIGNKTNHAPVGLPLDDAIFIPGSWGANGTGCSGIVTTGAKAVTPGAVGTPCSTTANQNSRFALTIANPFQGNQYQGGGGGSVLIADSAYANYNGLVATIQHRLSSAFSLLANYTWSKCLDLADSIGDVAATTLENPNNPRLDYAPCGSDYRTIINTTVVAKSDFHQFNRIGKLALNNWEIAPLMHFQSGVPFNVTAGSDGSLTDNNNLDRPNLIPGVPIYTHVKLQSASTEASRGYLNQAAFCTYSQASCAANNPASGTYGNIGRNAFRGPSVFQLDSQISRIFPIHESLAVDFRIEAFNMLNHPTFSTPTASNPASGSFGQISASFNTNNARVFQGGLKILF